MAKNSKMKKIKQLPWGLIFLIAIIVLNVGLILDYTIMDLIGETEFTEVGFNNFLVGFTYTCDILYIGVNILLLFIKEKSKSIINISTCAFLMIIFWIIKFCLIWF